MGYWEQIGEERRRNPITLRQRRTQDVIAIFGSIVVWGVTLAPFVIMIVRAFR